MDFAAVLLEQHFVEALQAYLASLNAPKEMTEEEAAKPEAENPVISAF